ncbi:farnesyl-diphosphate farnesyltransferase [Micromonospora viridifaciens]|uniref:Farnesyl-diphosphate farnesyltransferase n=1 Tax=Micromonospora viridifaciens TaxID=1881 RepID=A0A1C4XHE2_MICVI|nr:presqualene diphosphate synthase HpnD [Micromonospora viridifaciens]SCF07796.1 farnesyl-diphosphate farnesyltransferase [Micromonospora viridifaciens]
MTTICDVDTAYRRCEQITRSRAANFAYGIRLLPPVRRRALSAIYATARRIDDIGDGTMAPDEKLDHLARTREALHQLPGNDDGDPVLTALADAAVRLPIPLAAFDELIDGCAADVTGRTYATFDDLHWYCRCVAGSIGRLSLGVFGVTDRVRAEPLADALGVALQLTNILRDLVEDRADGRIYLPAEDLDRFGCTLRLEGGRFTDPPDRLIELVRFQAQRAAQWYDTGLRLLPLLDRRSAACTAAMAGIYRRLLTRIAADPLAVTRSRVSLPVREKAWVAARALVGRTT